jgi:vitamin B12 transporter
VLTGGARLDRWTIANGRLRERILASGVFARNEQPADRDGWEGTGRAGVAWNLGQVTLRTAAYLGWRLPTLNELYRPFRVGADATAANAALNPERMRGGEIGIAWQADRNFGFGITAFSNRLVRPIANVTLANGPGTFPGVGFVAAGGVYRQRQNIDAIRSQGVEFDLRWRRGDWSLAASYALTDARVRSSGLAVALDGLRPAQVPRHTASATLGWSGLSVTTRYVAAQFEDDLNRRRLDDAFTIDAVADVPITRTLRIIARGENLFDTRVETAISGGGVIERATPRTFWLGLSFRPGGK